MLGLMLLTFAYDVLHHGEPKSPREHHAGWSALGAIITCAILYAGGFFG